MFPDSKPFSAVIPSLPPLSFEEDEASETGEEAQFAGKPLQDANWLQNIQENGEDPEWPPFPTMSQSGDSTALANSKRVDLRPRLGKDFKGEQPKAQQQGFLPSRSMADENRADEAAKPGMALAEAVLQFNCPACLQWLEVAQGSALFHVSCPSCSSLIAPPRMVQATAARSSGPPKNTLPQRAEEKTSSIFRPNREQSAFRFIRQSSKKGKTSEESHSSDAY